MREIIQENNPNAFAASGNVLLDRLSPEYRVLLGKVIGLKPPFDQETLKFALQYSLAVAQTKAALQEGTECISGIEITSGKQSLTMTRYREQTENAMAAIRGLEISERDTKNRLTHLFGLGAFSRSVRKKFGGGAVGLSLSEQQKVILQIEQHFASSTKRRNSKFLEGVANYKATLSNLSPEGKYSYLAGLLPEANTLEELAEWYDLVGISGFESDDKILAPLGGPFKDKLANAMKTMAVS